jgi:hypothetical protein
MEKEVMTQAQAEQLQREGWQLKDLRSSDGVYVMIKVEEEVKEAKKESKKK